MHFFSLFVLQEWRDLRHHLHPYQRLHLLRVHKVLFKNRERKGQGREVRPGKNGSEVMYWALWRLPAKQITDWRKIHPEPFATISDRTRWPTDLRFKSSIEYSHSVLKQFLRHKSICWWSIQNCTYLCDLQLVNCPGRGAGFRVEPMAKLSSRTS